MERRAKHVADRYLPRDADAAGYAFSAMYLRVTEAAFRCLLLSATSAALGLCLLTGLQLRYMGANAQTFATLARNRFNDGYAYFPITARLPLFALCFSIFTFSMFLLIVAYVAWPSAVLALGIIGAALVGLQSIVKAVEMFVCGIARLVRGVRVVCVPVADGLCGERNAVVEMIQLRTVADTVLPGLSTYS
ncbi:unnamed protein product [Peniophora sp. CBMAI 1063]|nr:unnamed protein product [Peniophora sp. CBMAI 1063]